MNTMGIGKSLSAFWIGTPYKKIITGWREVVKFTMNVYRKLEVTLDGRSD